MMQDSTNKNAAGGPPAGVDLHVLQILEVRQAFLSYKRLLIRTATFVRWQIAFV